MRVYHFTSQDFGLRAIKEHRLKIGRISELNDPFEFLGWNLRGRQTRTTLKQWKTELNAEIGILCFSKEWSNPLLWGHYADKHKGMALGFDVPDDSLHPVKYCRNRLPAPNDHQLFSEDVNNLLLTKFSAWRYESEYRYFCRLDESINEGGLYFRPLSPFLKLAQVIVGERATVTRIELASALGDQYSGITSFKARSAFGTFSVVRNRDATSWK